MFSEVEEAKDAKIARLIKEVISGTASDDEKEELETLQNELKNDLRQTLFTTNATPEGLEKELPRNKGMFSAVSSEQGLFNTLFGNRSYANANFDIVLNAFDGGYVSFSRTIRKGFAGVPAGAIVCFAQDGSIDTVLEAGSNGIGLSERFLMLSEPHRLGLRDRKAMFLGTAFNDLSAMEDYTAVCNNLADVFSEPEFFKNLSHLRLSDAAIDELGDYLLKIEPYLANGEQFSHSSLRGACGKVDI
jgi:hypothetical protein